MTVESRPSREPDEEEVGGIEASLRKREITVLLVDDQAMIAEAVRRMLMDEKDINFHHCMKATEAEQSALRICPTVILQDLVMPSIEGLDLVRRYRSIAETRDIPVIVLSTKEDPSVKAEAFAVGANDYLVKLPDKTELVARLRYHSQSRINKLQRDEAFSSLQESQRQLEEANFQLLQLSNRDGLTGIANRRYFDEQIDAEWRRTRREKSPLAVLMMDVDYFKLYNDSLGHLHGDECLKRVADILAGTLKRPGDLLARYGGEEFVALLPGNTVEAAAPVAETMRASVEAAAIEHPRSEVSEHVTISVGAASTVPCDSSSPDVLVRAADEALYEAKHAGRNRVVSSETLPQSARSPEAAKSR